MLLVEFFLFLWELVVGIRDKNPQKSKLENFPASWISPLIRTQDTQTIRSVKSKIWSQRKQTLKSTLIVFIHNTIISPLNSLLSRH